jgi:hypothetical protein
MRVGKRAVHFKQAGEATWHFLHLVSRLAKGANFRTKNILFGKEEHHYCKRKVATRNVHMTIFLLYTALN